mgnify:CR=1 FL=1
MRIATDEVAQNKGAMLAMNNQINAARYVTKTHTANVESFKSGDYGVLGEATVLKGAARQPMQLELLWGVILVHKKPVFY